MAMESTNGRILIAIPVFNDWASLSLLIKKLDEVMPTLFDILIIDDASTVPYKGDDFVDFKNIRTISILELKRNLGHQRAIALGLAYIEANLGCQAVIVMDADGEDDPIDVPRLINKCADCEFSKMIFARRMERSENLIFKFFYSLYRKLYRILTGHEIRVGNFSIIPYKHLQRLVVVSEIWNHYAVGALKARLAHASIAVRRGHRLAGKSTMNFVSLVTHGLSAISVYGDTVGARLLIASCLLIVLSILGIFVATFIRLTTTFAIPGWTSYVVGIFLIIMIQSVILSLFFIFIVLGGRNSISFIPQRDYLLFILEYKQVFQCPILTSAKNSTCLVEQPTGRIITEDFSKNI